MRFIIPPKTALTALCCLLGSLAHAGDGTWTASNLAPTTNIIQAHPNNPDQLYAGTQADGLFQRDLSQTSSSWEPMDAAAVYANNNVVPSFSALLVNPNDPEILIAGTENSGIFIGEPNTQTWDELLPPQNDAVSRLLANNSANGLLFYASFKNSGVFNSDVINDINAWKNVSTDLKSQNINDLASVNGTVLAATHIGVFATQDAGATWQTSGNIFQFRDIQALSNSPNFSNVVYASAPNYGVFKTVDAGATWQTINSGLNELSVNNIHVHAQNPDVALLNTNNNVYLTINGGLFWQAWGVGLENNFVSDLLIENRRELRAHAATELGVFEIDFNINVESKTQNLAPVNTLPAQLANLIINEALFFKTIENGLQVFDAEANGKNIRVSLETDNGVLNYNQDLNLSGIELDFNGNTLTITGPQQVLNIILSTVSLIPDRLGASTFTMFSDDLGSGSPLAAQQSNSVLKFDVIAADALIFNSINKDFTVGVDSFFELLFDNIGYLAAGNGEEVRFSLENAPENIRIDAFNGDIIGEFNQIGTQVLTLIIQQGTQILRQDLSFNVKEQSDYDVLQIVGEELPNPLIIPVDELFEFILPISGGDGSLVSFSLDNIPDGLQFDGQEGLVSWIPEKTGLFNLTLRISQSGEDHHYPLNILVSDNHRPSLAFIDTQILTPKVPFNFTAQGSDIDGDALRYRLEDAPLGALIDPQTGNFSWTPTEPGEYLVTVIVEEQALANRPERPVWEVHQQVLLEVVLEGNAPPEFEPIGTLRLQPGIPFSIAIKASDPNNDPLFYELENPQLGMQLDANTGVFNWANPVIGTYVVTVEVAEKIDPNGAISEENEGLEDEMHFILRVGNDIDSIGEPSWQVLGQGLAEQSLQQLLISPANDNVMYVGSAAGVYKSFDGGQTWASSNQGLGTSRIEQLQINPNNAQILYARNNKGLFRSSDAGQNWKRLMDSVTDLDISSFTLDIENPNTLYFGTTDGQVFLSENTGDSFKVINADNKLPSAVNTLLVDRNEFEILYAGTKTNSIFKSFEQGIVWQGYGGGLDLDQRIDKLFGHPDNMDVIYALTPEGLKASYSTGLIWTNLNAGLEELTVNVLLTDPDHVDIIYVGTNKGAYRSLDAGKQWHRFGENLEDKNITAFALSNNLPPTLYAATETAGVYFLPDSDILPQEKDELEDLGIDEDDLLTLDDASLERLPLAAFGVLDAEDVFELPIEIMDRFNAQRLGALTEEAISGLSLAQFQALTDAALAGFNGKNIGGLDVVIIENITPVQLTLFDAAKIKIAEADDLAYFISHLNPNFITPSDVSAFLPIGWSIDPNSGDLSVPENTLLRFNSFANASSIGADVELPTLPDLSQTFGLGGQGSGSRLLDEFNRSLDNDAEFGDLSFEQNNEGIIDLSTRFAFIPDPQSMRQAPADAPIGFAPATDGSGRYILTTPTQKQFVLNPAPKNVSETLGVLQNAFKGMGIGLKLQLKANGELILEGSIGAGRRATPSRVHRVVVFDSVIEPAPPGMGSGITAAPDGNILMVFPDQTAQKVYPAILLPNEFKRAGEAITGVSQILNHADGTSTVTFAGIHFKITPTFETTSRTLGKGEIFKTKIEPWVKAGVTGLRYSVQSQDQVITTRLLAQLTP